MKHGGGSGARGRETGGPAILEPPRRRRGRILVVEDNDQVRQALVRILDAAGFHTVAAANGRDGLALLGADPTIVLVLLDLMMPEMDGRQFRAQQLADTATAAIPTVIITGSEFTPSDIDRLRPADYLLKPVRRDALVGVVSNYCEPDVSSRRI